MAAGEILRELDLAQLVGRDQPRVNANERESEIKSENEERHVVGDYKSIARIYFSCILSDSRSFALIRC